MTMVKSEKNELVPTRTITGWRVCIEYQKLNKAIREDHLSTIHGSNAGKASGEQIILFSRWIFWIFSNPNQPTDQEKTTFTCPYGAYAYKRMSFGLCNVPTTFQRCMIAIFQDMLEISMEVFMDDFFEFGNSFNSCLANLEQMRIQCI
ncbi:hypothetical protein Tco_0662126 [Tanacetum coccineum]